MNTKIQIIGQNAQNFAFPTIVQLKTLVTIIVWQSPTFEPLFPSPNVERGQIIA
jgi:hypothetical protein